MARNLTIFGPNRSRRRELKFEKFSNERAKEQTNDLYKKIRKFFEFFSKFSAGPPKPGFELSFWMLFVVPSSPGEGGSPSLCHRIAETNKSKQNTNARQSDAG